MEMPREQRPAARRLAHPQIVAVAGGGLRTPHDLVRVVRYARAVREAPPVLTERFLAAVALASTIHTGRRLGTEIPYMAHLLVVTGLVLEDGGGETEAIAAILHDCVEDGGGRPLLQHIESEFGQPVAAIVEACSDTLDPDDPRSWRERKESYLEHLPAVTDDAVLRVALADKVHNARSIVRDYRSEGQALWQRFTNKTAADQLWYYTELLAFFSAHRDGPLVEDLRLTVAELADLIRDDPNKPD
jgi:(p)ppGpp synthase/HD superfamily hydrolase